MREVSESNQHKQNAYIIKLFDRSVDLALFNTSTPLYPICRAWMRNNPAVREPAASPCPPHSMVEEEVTDMINGAAESDFWKIRRGGEDKQERRHTDKWSSARAPSRTKRLHEHLAAKHKRCRLLEWDEPHNSAENGALQTTEITQRIAVMSSSYERCAYSVPIPPSRWIDNDPDSMAIKYVGKHADHTHKSR
ncbi:protein lin-37 homolog isoform X1 [Lates japonicus]|uniref:Protein lin-37 homolog isoform X1 n=1 Tax=Lates japonicus TaxID=270547 RepID=A0AAD3MXF7_LATJO|nr:protein lin-37 homolog isoform X1 [Lates japonicus]